MSTLKENVDIIRAQVSRMKEALGVDPTTPLEEVTVAVEQGGGATGNANIYKVGTIEEMNALENIKEEDMCVVHGFMKTVLDQNTTTLTGTLYMEEDTITSDTAITSTTSVSFRDANYDLDVRFQVTATMLMIRVTDYLNGYTTYQTRYNSTDGITYTYASGPREIPLSKEVTKSGTTWNNIFTKAVYAGDLSFSGLYQYLEGSWDYAKIGMDPAPSTVFSTSKYYSDSGIRQGTFVRANHKENYITVSNTEPEIKTKLWFKPLVKFDGTASTSTITDSSVGNYVNRARKYSDALNFYKGGTLVSNFTSSSYYGGMTKAIHNGYLYVFIGSDDSNNASYKINLSTGAYSTVKNCPYSAHTMWDSSTVSIPYGNYIYCFSSLTASGNCAGMRRYYPSGNSWTSINTTDQGYSNTSPASFFEYNDKWYIFCLVARKIMIFTPSSNSTTVKDLPSNFITAGYTNRAWFQDGGKVYFERVYSSSNGAEDLGNAFFIYNLETNTVSNILLYDKADKPGNDDYPPNYFRSGTETCKYGSIIYEGDYAYLLGETDGGSSYNYIATVNIPIIKEAFTKNDAYIVFKKHGIVLSEVAMADCRIARSVLHTDGYLYSYTGKTVYKFTLQDILNNAIPCSSKYTLVFDTSSPKYNFLVSEKERLMFSDIYLMGTRGYACMTKGNTYVLNEDTNEYELLIENVVE